ncbi:hypothetical protein KKB10_00860 [Patescibacteria group bacterium]|nr:hypothetical protein [Patescibacteria group bacterium]MBU1952185.1 hypothetical protein [Patescibacteria group bacterium]MBU2229104.1 hypothetical protein [Patescibacteria group bacterium]
MPKKSKKNSSARILECRDGRTILCTDVPKVIGFSAEREGGQFRITNRSELPITVAQRRRAVPPGENALVPKDTQLQVGERKFICR